MWSFDKTTKSNRVSSASRILLILCACALFGDVGLAGPFIGAYSWIVQDGDSDGFKKEIELAEQAQDRDTRVRHLQQALTCRPGHPGNIAIEYHIAVEWSVRSDPEHPQPLRREDALKVVEGIVSTYKHMDYYSPKKVNSVSSKQLMFPQAAIKGACLERGLNRNSGKARKYTLLAMECMKETCEKRIDDWKAEQPPSQPAADDPVRGGVMGMSKWRARMNRWRERQEAAAKGEVLGGLEMATVKAAVRQFGYTYGPQKPEEVAIAMNEVIRLFPGTPMAKVAQGHIDRATKMVKQKLLRDFVF